MDTQEEHNVKRYIYTMNKFLKYKDKIEYLTLHGLGEPLLDKGLTEKVKIAKDMGFREQGLPPIAPTLQKKCL